MNHSWEQKRENVHIACHRCPNNPDRSNILRFMDITMIFCTIWYYHHGKYKQVSTNMMKKTQEWLDDIQKWWKMDICNIYRRAQNRELWSKVVRSAVDTNGQWAHYEYHKSQLILQNFSTDHNFSTELYEIGRYKYQYKMLRFHVAVVSFTC